MLRETLRTIRSCAFSGKQAVRWVLQGRTPFFLLKGHQGCSKERTQAGRKVR